MNSRVAYNLRAVLALSMKESGGFSFRDIRHVLKLSGPDVARRLVARGEWLRRQPVEQIKRLTGCIDSKGRWIR